MKYLFNIYYKFSVINIFTNVIVAQQHFSGSQWAGDPRLWCAFSMWWLVGNRRDYLKTNSVWRCSPSTLLAFTVAVECTFAPEGESLLSCFIASMLFRRPASTSPNSYRRGCCLVHWEEALTWLVTIWVMSLILSYSGKLSAGGVCAFE